MKVNRLKSPPSLTFVEDKTSYKFKKLLSNKLQAKLFSKSDLFNSFKAPSRNTFLEQYQKTRTQSSIPYIIVQEQPQIQNLPQNNKLFPIKSSRNSDATPILNMQKMSPQWFETTTTTQKKRLNTHQSSTRSVPITPDISSSPRKKITFNLNSAKIPSGLTTESTLNLQIRKPLQLADTMNSFFQVQYLSRTKDKAFLEMIEKSKNQKVTILNQLDIPTYQDYKNFMSRQNALQQLLQDYRKPSKINQYIEPNETKESQQPNYIYTVKNNINRNQSNNVQQNDIQGRVEKSLKIKQWDLQNKVPGEIDQQLFESYLDYNTVQNTNRSDSPSSKSGSNKNNKATIQQENNVNLDQSNSNSDQIDSTQYQSSFRKMRKDSDQKLLQKSSTLFNPNAFAQENYLSVAKKKSILQKRIEKLKSQQLNQSGSFNIENSDFIIENSITDDKNTQNSQRSDSGQMSRLEQQIKNNAFSVINSPKSNKYDDERIILSSSSQRKRNLSSQRQLKRVEQQQDDETVKICDIMGDSTQEYQLQNSNDKRNNQQSFSSQLKQLGISARR